MCPKERSPSGRPGRLADRGRGSGAVRPDRGSLDRAIRGPDQEIRPVAGSRIPSAVGLARRGRGKWIPAPRPVKRGGAGRPGAAADPGRRQTPGGGRPGRVPGLFRDEPAPRGFRLDEAERSGKKRGRRRARDPYDWIVRNPSRISSSPSAARDPLEALNHHPLPLPSRYRRELGALPGHLDRYRNL